MSRNSRLDASKSTTSLQAPKTRRHKTRGRKNLGGGWNILIELVERRANLTRQGIEKFGSWLVPHNRWLKRHESQSVARRGLAAELLETKVLLVRQITIDSAWGCDFPQNYKEPFLLSLRILCS